MGTDKTSGAGRIEKHVLIQASPSIIFEALTNARELSRWFCDRATSDPRLGGELTAYWKSGRTGIRGRAVFTRLVADRELELSWVDDGRGETGKPASHVLSYTIRARGETSELIMTDRDDPAPDEEVFAALVEGWNSVLLELKDCCERKERSGKRPPAEAS